MGGLDDMQEVVDAARKGLIGSAIAEVFPLKEVQKAHDAMEAADRFGKIILSIQ